MIAHTLANGSSAMRTHGMSWKLATSLASGLALALAAVTMPSVAATEPTKETAAKDAKAETDDVLIFRNGTTLKGKIVSETPTTLKFKGMVSGISLETEYNKNEILEIKRGSGKSDGKGEAKTDAPAPAAAPEALLPKKPAAIETNSDQIRYYYLELTGNFAEQITQTPIRDAIKKAKDAKSDMVIMMLDANWERQMPGDKKLDVEGAQFDQFFRAEEIIKVYTTELESQWELPKKPRIVFWIKQAMGGAAFMPLASREIYFHSSARMGGVGNLGGMFGAMGDEVVRKKQESLRLKTAVGWANRGGYPEVLIRAMTMREFVLSVKFEGGQPVYFERMPESPDEILLTDDGEEGNRDTIQQAAMGETNDVLTLKADIAQKLGVSKGTVDTKEELLTALGLTRVGVDVSNNSQRIMKQWADGLDAAKRQLKRLRDEYQEIRVDPPGGYNERTKARGQQMQKLQQMKRLLQQWEEALSRRWLQQNGIPSIEQIDNQIDALKIEQLKDKR